MRSVTPVYKCDTDWNFVFKYNSQADSFWCQKHRAFPYICTSCYFGIIAHIWPHQLQIRLMSDSSCAPWHHKKATQRYHNKPYKKPFCASAFFLCKAIQVQSWIVCFVCHNVHRVIYHPLCHDTALFYIFPLINTCVRHCNAIIDHFATATQYNQSWYQCYIRIFPIFHLLWYSN